MSDFGTLKMQNRKQKSDDLVLERPGFGGFVIDFRADVHEVVHAHRIFEALLHKSPFGATLPCRCNLVIRGERFGGVLRTYPP